MFVYICMDGQRGRTDRVFSSWANLLANTVKANRAASKRRPFRTKTEKIEILSIQRKKGDEDTKLQSDQQFVAVARPVVSTECCLYCTYCVCCACLTVGTVRRRLVEAKEG